MQWLHPPHQVDQINKIQNLCKLPILHLRYSYIRTSVYVLRMRMRIKRMLQSSSIEWGWCSTKFRINQSHHLFQMLPPLLPFSGVVVWFLTIGQYELTLTSILQLQGCYLRADWYEVKEKNLRSELFVLVIHLLRICFFYHYCYKSWYIKVAV